MKLQLIPVIEDEALILLDVESALMEAGFQVLGASSAATAIEAFDGEPSKFVGLITDIRLGKGQSGWDIARHVRRSSSAMPVIYMSGDSAPAWPSEGVPQSVMIQKPFVMAQIVTALSTLLNQTPLERFNDPSTHS